MTRTLLELLARRNTVLTRRNSRARRPDVEAVEARCLLANVLWDLPGDGNWNTAANWVVEGTSPPVHRVPTATDDVSIPGTAGEVVTVTLSSAVSVNSLNVTNSGGANTLDITGGSLTIGAGEDSWINTLHLSEGATINVPANAVMTIGDGSTIAGTIDVAALGTFNFAGSGSGIDIDSGASSAGSGLFDAPNAFGSLRIDTPLTLPQNFEVAGGWSDSLVLNANVSTGDNFTFASGAIAGSGSLTVPSGATFTWLGGGGGDTVGNTGGMTIATGAILNLPGSNGAELATGTLTNNGTINWSGQGQLSGTDGGTIDNNAAFNITGDSAFRRTDHQQLRHDHQDQPRRYRHHFIRHWQH